MSVNKNVFYTTLTQLPILVIGTIVGIFITRLLGPGGKGIYAIFQADIELFTIIFSFSLHTGLVYFISNKRIHISKLIAITIYICFFSTIIVFLILILFRGTMIINFLIPENYSTLFYYAYFFFSFIISLVSGFLMYIFQGKSNFRKVNQMKLITAIFNISIFGGLFYANWQLGLNIGVKEIFIASLGILIINFIIWLFWYHRHIGARPNFNLSLPNDVKPLFIFIGLGYASVLMNFFSYRLDIWVIHAYSTLEQLGLYTLGVNIAQMFWLISNSIAAVLYPYFSKSNDKDSLKVYTLFSKINFTLILILMTIAFFVADNVIPMIYGQDFVGSILPFKILLFGIFFNCLFKILAHYVLAKGGMKYAIIAAITGLLITIVLDLTLIPQYGIIGASIATSISYFATFITISLFSFSKLNLPFRNYYLLSFSDMHELLHKFKTSVRKK